MLALAAHETSEPLSSRRIAEEWRIPAKFLVQVLGRLSDCGLVTAALGRNGGYRLGRPASQISLLDVVTAIEEQPIERRSLVGAFGPPNRADRPSRPKPDRDTIVAVRMETEVAWVWPTP